MMGRGGDTNLSQSRLLAQRPETQQRLRAECLALPSYKAKHLPTKDELKSMKYLSNVIHEGQYSEDHGLSIRQTTWLMLHSTPLVPISTHQHASSYEVNRPSRRRRL